MRVCLHTSILTGDASSLRLLTNLLAGVGSHERARTHVCDAPFNSMLLFLNTQYRCKTQVGVLKCHQL